MRNAITSCAIAAVLALPALAGAEDLTIVSKVTGPKPGTSTHYMSADRFRSNDGDHDSIMELQTGRMVMIDNQKKEYTETSLAEMSAFMEQMSKQMQGMPANLMPALGEVKVAKGQSPRKVAGYDCEHWIVSMGDSMRMELWTTADLTPPTQYLELRKAMTASMGPMARHFAKMYEAWSQIKGFPLAETTSFKMMGRETRTEHEAIEVKKGPIAPSVFDVPAGYRKKPSPFAGKQ